MKTSAAVLVDVDVDDIGSGCTTRCTTR